MAITGERTGTTRGRALLETVHIVAMGLWAGSLGMAGAVAAVVFPTMRSLDPTLNAYASYTEPHWRLAAGHVAASVFFASDMVQLVCAPLAGLTLVVMVLTGRVAWPSRVIAGRLVVITLLMALLSYRFFILAPRMDRELSMYRVAARTGQMEVAATHLAAFNADHPAASRVLSATFGLVLVGLIVGAWSASSGAGNVRRGEG